MRNEREELKSCQVRIAFTLHDQLISLGSADVLSRPADRYHYAAANVGTLHQARTAHRLKDSLTSQFRLSMRVDVVDSKAS